MILPVSTIDVPKPAVPGPARASVSEIGHDSAIERHEALRDSLVMIVDDEVTTINVVQAFLEDAGYRNFVTTSRSGEALELMEKELPDVVLLDVSMPEVSGYDILGAMRSHRQLEHTPVIIFTASADSETKLRALNLGATDFLSKPVDPSELILRIRNTLAAKAYLDRLTYFDSMTGLPNRLSFAERLDGVLSWAREENKTSAVLLVDLDRFKEVNETLGHTAGDELLQKIARRLERCVRHIDAVRVPLRNSSWGVLSRVGGDEFTIVLSDVTRTEDAGALAERIGRVLSRPMVVAGQQLVITPSIGIAFSPEDGSDRETLLRHAEIAMSHAKQKGRNTYQHFSDSISAKSKHQLSLQAQLHHVVERDELLLHYQPKVDIRTGVIIGCEALVRWQHPERGLVPPAEFIWLAEEAGLLSQIGEWALATACAQNAAWQAASAAPLSVAVNISSRQFRDGQLIRSIQRALESSRLRPEHLIVELTERTVIEEAQENVDVLQRIKSMGVALSVDDFGTGYSSLRYLEQFPLDELKIDRAFVKKIDALQAEAPIVSAIIAMAHSLRFSVVAEGVDSETQLEFLRARGCDAYQGFLFSEPVSADKFANLLSAWRPPANRRDR